MQLPTGDPAIVASPNASLPTLLLLSPLRLVRESLGFALEGRLPSWHVVTASDPQQAIDSCRDQRPQAALLDVGPDHGQLHWGASLLETWPQLPVMVLDDTPNDTLVRLALSLGFAGYVTKQQPLSALVSAIEEVVQGRRVFSPEIAARLRVTASGLRLVDNQPTPWSKLTARELDVLALIAQGHTVASAAKLLGISSATVDNHKTRLMHKLGIHKATQLAAWAVSVGLVTSAGTSPHVSPQWSIPSPGEATSAPLSN